MQAQEPKVIDMTHVCCLCKLNTARLLPVCLQTKALAAAVSATAPRVAERVKDLQERLRALQQRYIKILVDRW